MKRALLVLSVVSMFAGAVAAAPIADVTTPGDSIVGTSMNYPGAEAPPNAIDNNPGTKYLNFDKLNSGFTVTLDGFGPAALTGIALRTADDSPDRDPASVTITASNDGVGWSPIISDLITALPDARFTEGEFLFTPVTAGAFSMYSVVFPTVKNAAGANSMQIGEVRLMSEDAAPPPPPPFDFTKPTDSIIVVHGVNDGDASVSTPGGDNPPPNEGVAKAIDNDPNTKYLNFLDLGSGFMVVLDDAGPSALNGIALTTANDAPPRDPASVTIRGSNDGANWSAIVTDLPVALPDARFTEVEFDFVAETAGEFLMYEVTFPTLRDAAAANSMQIGEVRLLPEPASLALLGLGCLVALRRRG